MEALARGSTSISRKKRRQSSPNSSRQHVVHHGEGQGQGAVEQPGELIAVGRGQRAGVQGQQLADLDKGGPQGLKELAQPDGAGFDRYGLRLVGGPPGSQRDHQLRSISSPKPKLLRVSRISAVRAARLLPSPWVQRSVLLSMGCSVIVSFLGGPVPNALAGPVK